MSDAPGLQPWESGLAFPLPPAVPDGQAGREGAWLVVNSVLPRQSCDCSSCKIC